MEKLLSIAISITAEAFKDKLDKGGKPYILHCLWVMNKVRHLGTDYMIVAVLHDLIEDTNWTYDDLKELGFPDYILNALSLLDFRNKNYQEQIELLAVNKIAREVKLRDLEHNSKITRMKGLRMEDFKRLQKYNYAYQYLKH